MARDSGVGGAGGRAGVSGLQGQGACDPRQIPFDFAQGRLSPRWKKRAVFGMTPFKTHAGHEKQIPKVCTRSPAGTLPAVVLNVAFDLLSRFDKEETALASDHLK